MRETTVISLAARDRVPARKRDSQALAIRDRVTAKRSDSHALVLGIG